jgi:DNA-binding transcriptional LysR family regulator
VGERGRTPFLAVAADSNFSPAATRLHMTQPALSRQIQSLETEVGARLFERDRQGTRLTPAGDQFRKDAEQLLELSVAAQRRARKAAMPPSLFSVGFMPGVPLHSHHPRIGADRPAVQQPLRLHRHRQGPQGDPLAGLP